MNKATQCEAGVFTDSPSGHGPLGPERVGARALVAVTTFWRMHEGGSTWYGHNER